MGLHTEPIELGLSADGNMPAKKKERERRNRSRTVKSSARNRKKQKNIMEKNYKTEDTVIVVVSGVSSVENQS